MLIVRTVNKPGDMKVWESLCIVLLMPAICPDLEFNPMSRLMNQDKVLLVCT